MFKIGDLVEYTRNPDADFLVYFGTGIIIDTLDPSPDGEPFTACVVFWIIPPRDYSEGRAYHPSGALRKIEKQNV